MVKLSPSSLSLMTDCPRCFWLDKHDLWKRPVSMFPSLPNGMDRILKKHFDHFRDQNKLPPELKESDCSDCQLFSDKELLETWRNNLKGIRWEDEKGNILQGAVDNILVKNNKLIVLDYKTRGHELREDTHEHYQDQLDLYTLLLRKNNYETENYAYLIFYIPNHVLETGEVIFDTKLIKVPIDITNAEQLFQRGIKIFNSPCPQHTCQWCEFVDIKKL